MKVTAVAIGLLLTILAFSCSTNGDCSEQKPLNPNGDSELSLLMRLMYDDGMKIKEQIRMGEKPDISFDFEKIHTAEATEPDRMKTPDFDVFADSYIQAVQAYKSAAKEEAESYFNSIVTACMNCHQAVCPGPKVRIKKMYL